ncbi:hypothetical protein HMPREF1142_2251 [Peptostreptococcaceae bacterium AS15]|nr:hypothetical protein HMPREF1142_2251 [Peptostreptococcaceae bacterium AS15]
MKNIEKILKDLIKIYGELYEHRQILSCSKYFRYNVETVEKLSEYLTNNHLSDKSKNNIKPKTKKTKSAFSGITTRDEFDEFYYENLVYDRNDDTKRNVIIKRYSKADFQEMFLIIFGSMPNGTKERIFSDIQYFYDSLERSTRI